MKRRTTIALSRCNQLTAQPPHARSGAIPPVEAGPALGSIAVGDGGAGCGHHRGTDGNVLASETRSPEDAVIVAVAHQSASPPG
jgi:hypothetical protein